MEEKKYYRHQSYKRFKVSIDDWTYISFATTNLDVKEYDLTEEEVKEYIEFTKESQVKYKQFKNFHLSLWRTAYIVLCLFFFAVLLFVLPKLVVTIILWLLFSTLFLVLYPLYVLYKGLEVICDYKYQNSFFKIDPHIERMVDDYKWWQHIKSCWQCNGI